MKLIIEIPEEFEIHFMQDKFEDFFIRIIGDMSRNVPSLCGVDEKEIAEMLKTAFLNSKAVYHDVNEVTCFEKVVNRLTEELILAKQDKERCARENQTQFDFAKGYSMGVTNALEIVKAGES
jgi:hypothetical protein